MGIENKNEYKDFICFYDDDDIEKQLFVKVIKCDSILKFETQNGNIITIPMHRVKKVKQKKEGTDVKDTTNELIEEIKKLRKEFNQKIFKS